MRKPVTSSLAGADRRMVKSPSEKVTARRVAPEVLRGAMAFGNRGHVSRNGVSDADRQRSVASGLTIMRSRKSLTSSATTLSY
jgi:hypothetical protein